MARRNFTTSDQDVPDHSAGRWAAVVSRDLQFNGSFVYAVTTTGIYCKPSCPARRPHPKHVRYFPTPAAAKSAGFRACKRCKPDVASNQTTMEARVAAACRMIETADQPPSLAELSNAAGVSSFHFHRMFKAATGVTPKQYANAHRNSRVRQGLPSARTVTDALYAAGFNSSSGFYGAIAGTLGMKPKHVRTGGANMNIRYCLERSTLGTVLIAATDAGVCAVLLGDQKAALVEDLTQRFPKATLREAGNDLKKLAKQTIAEIDGLKSAAALPLDIRGTVFQHKVWQALRAIPPGETLTYGELAQKIGKPKAVRAVASACGANPIAVVIPCHRIVGANGKLTGYRWGLERKQRLIEREKKTNGKRR